MQNNYILLNRNNEILSFYYGEERAIYCKKLGSNNYPITNKIIQNVTDCFTVDIGPNKEIYIFCQNYNGDIILCKLEEDGFKNKVLFKNKNETLENILFYPIFFKGNMSLIYNTPNQFLAIKTLVGGKSWTNSENIDVLSTLPNNLFHMQKINQNNIIIAYQKKYKDIQIGYKEINNGNISDFIPIHKTGYQIVDYSFIAFKGAIHYIYIIKSLFSSQVLYKRKDENGISSQIILFEGQKIKSCNINILNNKLYCSFIVNSTLYHCQSEDFGRSFLGISKYRKPLSQDVVKAKFVSNNNLDGYYLNEIYIDSRNPLNIYMLPEFLPTLFNNEKESNQNNYNVKVNNEEKFITNLNSHLMFTNQNFEENTSNNNRKSLEQLKNVIPLENDFMSNFNPEQFSNFSIPKETITYKENNISINENTENNSILENRIKILNEQLVQKNSQILKLNNIIQSKNSEKTDIEINLRQKLKNMENENKNLLEKITKLEKEITEIKSQNISKPIESEIIMSNENVVLNSEKQNEEIEE